MIKFNLNVELLVLVIVATLCMLVYVYLKNKQEQNGASKQLDILIDEIEDSIVKTENVNKSLTLRA